MDKTLLKEPNEQELKPIAIKFAPVWKRVLAYIIDILILGIILSVMIWVIYYQELNYIINQTDVAVITKLWKSFFTSHQIILMIATHSIQAVYFTLFWAGTAQTLGNRLLRIAVVDISSQRLHFLSAFFRYALIALAAQIYYIPLIFQINQVYNQYVHDYIVGSVVIEVPQKALYQNLNSENSGEANQ